MKVHTSYFILLFTFLLPCTLMAKKSIIATGAKPIKVDSTYSFTEGPASDNNGNIYFTDQPNNRILKWSTENTIVTFLEDCGRCNGLYVDKSGMIIACADLNNQIWSINTETKQKEVILDKFKGQKLNGPNDLWITPKGGIYFTDPYYKRPYWTNPEKEIEKENVYYISPDRNSITIAHNNFEKPNGIIGTPDGKTLYVADIKANKTYRFTINNDGLLSDKTLFCEQGSDGMTIDNKGNIYLTGDGVMIFNQKGKMIEHIKINEKWTANVTFGGADHKTLFITAMSSVYTLKMNVKGAQ